MSVIRLEKLFYGIWMPYNNFDQELIEKTKRVSLCVPTAV